MGKDYVQRLPVNSTWRQFTNAQEDQRLNVIDERLQRLGKRASELHQEKGRIMMRAIRRKRRAEGKE